MSLRTQQRSLSLSPPPIMMQITVCFCFCLFFLSSAARKAAYQVLEEGVHTTEIGLLNFETLYSKRHHTRQASTAHTHTHMINMARTRCQTESQPSQ